MNVRNCPFFQNINDLRTLIAASLSWQYFMWKDIELFPVTLNISPDASYFYFYV